MADDEFREIRFPKIPEKITEEMRDYLIELERRLKNMLVGTFSARVNIGGDGEVYTGGDGIDITDTTISVDLATDPGLEFDSNKLRVKIQADEGLEREAAGLKVDPTDFLTISCP